MPATATRTRRRTPAQAPDAEETAARLLRSSDKFTLDPDTDIRWDDKDADGLAEWYAPPELLTLYGTPVWDGMSHQQRIELSRHEMCSIAATGIWFEVILLRMLGRHVYDSDMLSDHCGYVLTEVADECRHSQMFARMIKELGVEFHAPSRRTHELGRLMSTPLIDDAIAMGGTLYVEAVLDRMQRRAMDDDRVVPLVRDVSRVHVIDEARHMRLAATMLQRDVEAGMGPVRRNWLKLALPLIAWTATEELVGPSVYRAVGLDPRAAMAARRENPDWLRTRRPGDPPFFLPLGGGHHGADVPGARPAGGHRRYGVARDGARRPLISRRAARPRP